MNKHKPLILDSPLGKMEIDHSGSPVGVVRMDASKSYSGIAKLLQQYINDSKQEAWEAIKAKINYTYENLDSALSPLDTETSFSREIKSRVKKGQKLLFKPNLVNIFNIDPQTHGPDSGSKACTEWAFVAALMRWFHDKVDISYHQMALGEAATCMPAAASLYSMLNLGKGPVTTEAVIEGKAGDFYGGWGFYFVRKYLKESLEPGRSDDPMKGYDESLSGTFIPPGIAKEKLMVYDLNRIFDDPSKGRDVDVPDGVNFRSITLHKVVVGGDRQDPEDLEAYPGCILVNVPKFKVHAITLFTNVIKNLGIGLYPMQAAKDGQDKWDYSVPHNPIPGMKGALPHQVWVPEIDPKTGFPARDNAGNGIVRKTGGITATMIDMIQAVRSLDIYMIHIVDAIEGINQDHQGLLPGTKEPEGMVFAGLDPVATDLLCARYMFSNIPFKEALGVELVDKAGGCFPQQVPIPTADGNNIVTRMGYDCPLSRDRCLENAEKRNLGVSKYYVVGKDAVMDCPLVSLQGHLGRVTGETFSDLVTKTLYFDVYKMPWDMQETAFHYFEAVDKLAGSSLRKKFMETFDEDGDGIVTYEEFGKKGVLAAYLHLGGDNVSESGQEQFGYLRGPFRATAKILKNGDPSWNPQGHSLFKEFSYGTACLVAYRMSLMELEAPDPFLPNLMWGKGKWPSFNFSWYIYLGIALYGSQFPYKIRFPSLYALVFHYADLTQNQGRYSGRIRNHPDPDGISTYFSCVSNGQEKPLDFTIYIPPGYDKIAGSNALNVEVTTDPAKILTATFLGGKEMWAEI